MISVADFKANLIQSLLTTRGPQRTLPDLFLKKLNDMFGYYQAGNGLDDQQEVNAYFIQAIFTVLGVSWGDCCVILATFDGSPSLAESGYVDLWKTINEAIEKCRAELDATARGTVRHSARKLSFNPLEHATPPSPFSSSACVSASTAAGGRQSPLLPDILPEEEPPTKKMGFERCPASLPKMSSWPNSPASPRMNSLLTNQTWQNMDSLPGSPANHAMIEALGRLALQTNSPKAKTLQASMTAMGAAPTVPSELELEFDIPFMCPPGTCDRSMLNEMLELNSYFLVHDFDYPPLTSFEALVPQWIAYLQKNVFYIGQLQIPLEQLASFITRMLFQLKDNPCLILFEFIREYLCRENIIFLKMQPISHLHPYFIFCLMPSIEGALHYTLQFSIAITQLMDNDYTMYQPDGMQYPLTIELLVRVVINLSEEGVPLVNMKLIKCHIDTPLVHPSLTQILRTLSEKMKCDINLDDAPFQRINNKRLDPNYKTSYCFQGTIPLLLPKDVEKFMPDFNKDLLIYAARTPLTPTLQKEFDKSLFKDLPRSGLNIFESIPKNTALDAPTLPERIHFFKTHCWQNEVRNPTIFDELLRLVPQSTLSPFHYYTTRLFVLLNEIGITFSMDPLPKTTLWLKNELSHWHLICKREYSTITIRKDDGNTIPISSTVPLVSFGGRLNLCPTLEQPWYQFHYYIEPIAIDLLQQQGKDELLFEQFNQVRKGKHAKSPLVFIYQGARGKRDWAFYGDVFPLENGLPITLLGVETTINDNFSGRRAVLGGEHLAIYSTEQMLNIVNSIHIKGISRDDACNLLNHCLTALFQCYTDETLPIPFQKGSKLQKIFKKRQDAIKTKTLDMLEKELLPWLSLWDVNTEAYLTLLQYTALSQGCWLYCFQQKPADEEHPQSWLQLIFDPPKPNLDLQTVCILLNEAGTHFDRLTIV